MARASRRPVVDFGVHARKILEQALREGIEDYDVAWERVTSTIRPSDTSWGPLDLTGVGAGGGETPMQHLHRVAGVQYELAVMERRRQAA